PFDERVLLWEAAAVARAAMETGVARRPVDLEEYKVELERHLGKARHLMRLVINQARRAPKRVVFPEGMEEKVLRAAHVIADEGFARPILLGNRDEVMRRVAELGVELAGVTLVEPGDPEIRERYAQALFGMRQRKGMTLADARTALRDPAVWAAMMVEMGDADALVGGVGQHFPDAIRPPLQVIGKRADVARVAGLFLMMVGDEVYLFADPTVNVDPTAEELVDIALLAAEMARRFDLEPRVAMISFSNFGSVRHPFADKVREATRLLRERRPDLVVDGEMQADTAVVPELMAELYPFSHLEGGANVLVFPDLQSANVAYKLVQRLGGAEAIGPILMGMRRPVHILQRGCGTKDVVNMAAMAVLDAQELEAREGKTRPAAEAVPEAQPLDVPARC
ncbi:MAG TPA: phosphate acyltransferase, partial [Thermoanaerobaculia bacterium]|nr:phosphate acyltransferase [Thermoanaerobaculia bacterium]